MEFSCLLKVALSILLFLVPSAISYEAIEVARLPKELSLQSTYYDSTTDTVYLFGGLELQSPGQDFSSNYEIYSFSVLNNSVSKIGDIPKGLGLFTKTHLISIPSKSEPSTLDLYFLVPQSTLAEFTLVHLFNKTNGTLKQVGYLRTSLEFSEFAQSSNNGEVFFFGGHLLKDNIFKVTLDYEPVQWDLVGTLGQEFTGTEVLSIATVGNTAFLFGGNYDETLHRFPHITVNLENFESSDPLTILPDSPGFFQQRSISSTTDEIYVLSGFGTNDILRMNATTQDYQFESIMNSPLREEAVWYIAPGQVLVEKFNRIYFFGGTQMINGTLQNIDSIWYIQL